MTDSRGLQGAVQILLGMTGGDGNKMRREIANLYAIDPTFKRHWFDVLEVAADYRESSISAAYRIWKGLDPALRPPSTHRDLDLAALSFPPPGVSRQTDLKDSKDVRALQLIRSRNRMKQTTYLKPVRT